MGVALGHQRARLVVGQMDEQQVVARRRGQHFPVQIDADRLARPRLVGIDGIAAQGDERIEANVAGIGQRRPGVIRRRSRIGRSQIAEQRDEGERDHEQIGRQT